MTGTLAEVLWPGFLGWKGWGEEEGVVRRG